VTPALLSAMTATLVFAQAAIGEPGAFAFYHPNADVLNGGAPLGSFAAAPSSPTSPMRRRLKWWYRAMCSTTAPITPAADAFVFAPAIERPPNVCPEPNGHRSLLRSAPLFLRAGKCFRANR
jgi:hypothetical protein